MAWTTSDNLRELFAPQEQPADRKVSIKASAARLDTIRLVRHAAVLGLVIAHLMLLGDLAVTPDANEPKLATVAPAFGVSLSWLTITGMMLAILLLARDWPSSQPAETPALPKSPADHSDAGQSSTTSAPTPVTFALPARSISSQTRTEPMTGLLARVSHDLRTPLNAVMGFSDLMQQEAFGPLGDARYQSYARHIHASSAELLKAAEDTLAMTSLVANPQLAASEITDLSNLVSDAFTMALIGAPKPLSPDADRLPTPIMLALTIPPQLQVKCDRRALRQAMINLITAAIGKLGQHEPDARTIHVAATRSDDIVCLTINVMLDHQATTAAAGSSWNSAEDLPICLARALLDLQGLKLALAATPLVWTAQVNLDGVSQRDFFSL
jgi:signal transduction histidine kinase